jgi:hypothetical protein
MDQHYAPVYWRLMMGHRPLDDDLAVELVRNTLGGVALR